MKRGMLEASPGGLFDLKAPRSCNTGAQIPGHSVKVDWLEFTVKGCPPDSLVTYLGHDPADFVPCDYGMHGYTDCMELGAIKILFSPLKPERGSKAILSSVALDECAADAVEIIISVLKDGGTFARIDVAIDDRLEILDLELIELAVSQGEDVNHFSQVQPVKIYDRKKRCLSAHGINWGSRKGGGRFVRIYDKRLQQIFDKGLDDPGHWIRAELEAHKRSALVLAIKLATEGLDCIPGIMRGVLDFKYKNPEKKENVTKLTSYLWWDFFLKGAVKIKTGFKKIGSTIQDKALWMAHSVKKTAGQVLAIFGPAVFAQLLRDGIDAVTEKEWKRICPGFSGVFAVDRVAHVVYQDYKLDPSIPF